MNGFPFIKKSLQVQPKNQQKTTILVKIAKIKIYPFYFVYHLFDQLFFIERTGTCHARTTYITIFQPISIG